MKIKYFFTAETQSFRRGTLRTTQKYKTLRISTSSLSASAVKIYNRNLD